MIRLALVVTLAPLLISPLAAGAAQPYAPLAAFALKEADGGVIVSWVPGDELADVYRIYGVFPDGSLTLLKEAIMPLDATSQPISVAYPTYAVTGVKAGVESEPVVAVNEAGANCIEIRFNPPGYSLCKPHFAFKVRRA